MSTIPIPMIGIGKAPLRRFAEFGIEILAIGGTVLEGVKPAEHLFIARAMSMERLQAFYASPAYQSVIGYRHASADTHFLIAMPGPGESEWNDKSEEGDST